MWVVLFHFGEGGQIASLQALLPGALNTVVFTWGHFGVPIFFVLSGYVIALSIGTDRVNLPYVGRFALRRSIRLDPPYWLSIALTLSFVAIKSVILTGSASIGGVTAGSIFAHMFYLQDFLGLPAINSVYWTLAFEIQFYLLFCALLGIAHSFGKGDRAGRAFNIVFASAAVVSILWPLLPALHVRGLALPNWHGFMLGAFAYWAVTGRIRTHWYVVYAATLLGVFAVTRDSFTIVCLTTSAVILGVGQAGKLQTWMRAEWLQFLGKISYSLYLIHVPVSGAAFFVLARLLTDSPLNDFMAAVLVLAVNCIAAQLFWWGAERPSTAFGRRFKTR